MKKPYVLLAIAALAISTVVYLVNRAPESADDGRLRVVASVYPLYYFADAIGGNRAEVVTFTPSGVEPHDYEPTPRDIARLEASDLLILNGAGLEPWADNLTDILRNDIEVVRVGDDFATLQSALQDAPQNEEQDHVDEERDPHVWLDPLLAKQEAALILDAFIKVDSAGRDHYEKNAAGLNAEFDALDLAFREDLADCERRKIITSHAAFGYLAMAYGLEQVPIAGLSPDEEPSLQDLARVAELARRENVRYIFFEELVSPKLAETIAREVGAETLVLDPIESGTDYFSQMYANLENLKIALECQK